MKCRKCEVTDVKLWRLYQSMNINLLCVDYAIKHYDEPIEIMCEDGTHQTKLGDHYRQTDSISWHIPAVSVENEPDTYWGYTSVPFRNVQLWSDLPLRK